MELVSQLVVAIYRARHFSLKENSVWKGLTEFSRNKYNNNTCRAKRINLEISEVQVERRTCIGPSERGLENEQVRTCGPTEND